MQEAIVLIGPTGSGKSPLGQLLANRGLWGRRCVHFDFGATLRQIAAGWEQGDFNQSEIRFVRNVLETGALLEDSDFHIALRALQAELTAQDADEDCLIALNGLPRHVGQARDLHTAANVSTVVVLHCSPEVVSRRIATNSGGDRTGRRDDNLDAIAKRLEIFAQRTKPLADFYRDSGRAVYTIEVTETTTPQEIVDELNRRRPLQE
ncbi:MAG: nucleoside monophosphate kinase [Phycisphaerae bacterium]|jgi:adenylate kinase family enzyme|nr:nucleoside monophosphate kinase [Phycisphaerae bacterium]